MRKLILVAAVLVAASEVATAEGRVRQFFQNVAGNVAERRAERRAERSGGGCGCDSAPSYTAPQAGPVRTIAADTLNAVGTVFQNAGTLVLPQRGGCANGTCWK